MTTQAASPGSTGLPSATPGSNKEGQAEVPSSQSDPDAPAVVTGWADGNGGSDGTSKALAQASRLVACLEDNGQDVPICNRKRTRPPWVMPM